MGSRGDETQGRGMGLLGRGGGRQEGKWLLYRANDIDLDVSFFGQRLALLCASNLIQLVFLPPFFPLLPFFLLRSFSLPINIFWPLINVPGVP